MSGITHTRSATTSPTLPSIISSTSPSNQTTNTSPKKVTYQEDGKLSNEKRQSIDLFKMPTIITTKPLPSVPVSDLLKNSKQQQNASTTTLCFICELPILSHQCYSTWASNVSSPGLLSVTGIATAVANEDYSNMNLIYHEGKMDAF